ncbi:MAG: PBP1A family penicillin-binding protein [Parcubacteria group bacterium]|nr:PBP1A family penicillin-binding protein [Parcubacteria group bacterium]
MLLKGRLTAFLQWLLAAFFVLFILGGAVFLYYAKDLPRPERFSEISFAEPTRIYDRTGEHLLYELYGKEKRKTVALQDIPDSLKQAIIATEDSYFYSHWGLDWRGLARAAFANIKDRSPSQGGSTLTQQLVRTTFLSRTKTIDRKIKELVLTLEVERRYSKDQILELYLNQVPFGSNAYGVAEAANTYFAKEVGALTLEESGVLAAMIKAPSYYSPFGLHQEELLGRKDYVLSRMVDRKYISQEQADAAKSRGIRFAESSQGISAPHFSLMVTDELITKYGEDFVRENGLRVFTTLDWDLQKEAEAAVQKFSEQNIAYGAHNAALVAIDPRTGEILAMVGSRDWHGDSEPADCIPGVSCTFDPKLNVATALPGRQPGSSFKPFVYAEAFLKGATEQTVVVDEPTNFGIWGDEEYKPQNYDGKFRGPVTLRDALAQSLNVPSVKVLADIAGLQDSIEFAKRMGITTLTQDPSFYGLALVLGGGEVRLLDMVSAYGVFANAGKRVSPFAIDRIEDSGGSVLEKRLIQAQGVLPAEVAQTITDILSDNQARTPIFGARSPLYFPNARVAAKTGTTQNYKDGWIVGYTPDIVSGVWVGNNNGEEMRQEPGSVVAGPMWHQFMEYAISKPRF